MRDRAERRAGDRVRERDLRASEWRQPVLPQYAATSHPQFLRWADYGDLDHHAAIVLIDERRRCTITRNFRLMLVSRVCDCAGNTARRSAIGCRTQSAWGHTHLP